MPPIRKYCLSSECARITPGSALFFAQEVPVMNNRSIGNIVKTSVVATFLAAIVGPLLSGPTVGQAAHHAPTTPQSPGRNSPDRFDFLVRADFFAGFAGDHAALKRAMQVCEDTLARNPKHPEALVWRGSGLVFLAGQAFQQGDARKGVELWDRGLNEMDRAVELDPGSVGVLIPRGASLLTASRFVPDKSAGRALLEKGVGDYEKVLEIQKPYFSKLSSHARAELLFGLAEGAARLGNKEKATIYFRRIVSECKDSGRERQAAVWLEKGALSNTDAMSCTGCHTK
jgi:hypothetical protein